MTDMPTIDLSKTNLTGDDLAIASACLNKGKLRASKPKGDRETLGEAMYVWRMVAFQVSPNAKHHCMPITADFDLPARYWGQPISESAARRRERTKELAVIIDAMVNTVPKGQWAGVLRWGRALGAI